VVRLLVLDGFNRRFCALERTDLEVREMMEFIVFRSLTLGRKRRSGA